MVIEIIPASEKRKLVEAEKEKRAIEKEEQRKKEEEIIEKLICEWTESILYSLKVGIENKDNFNRFEYYLKYNNYYAPDFFDSQREATNNILNKCLKIIKEVLEARGYSVFIFKHSVCYQTQTNMFGYIAVSW